MAARASSKELLVPVQASLVIGASRGDQLVAFVLERIDVRLPHVSTIRGTHVRLARLVRPGRTMSA